MKVIDDIEQAGLTDTRLVDCNLVTSGLFTSGLVTSDRARKVIDTDVLIIGAGLAGLSTALALPKSLKITILSKAALQACSSHYAQGGIAASLDQADSVADHVADTLVAGAGLCAADNTTDILSAGQQAVQWLCEQGVPFTQLPKILDSTDIAKIANISKQSDNLNSQKEASVFSEILHKSKVTTADLHLTKEGGHGCRRVAHADDATGRHIMQTLVLKAQAASNITILAFHEALQLLTSSEDGHCQGAIVFNHAHQRQLAIHSRAVVMASGGLGQLFARASAPNICVGDGVMMAWQAGCRLANLEFVQFHPTGLALANSSFLISEALRGEGGRLTCPLTGKRFMLELDARAELAPRDIVARAIAEQISHNGLGYVHLDVSHLSPEFLQAHFPQIYRTLLDLGIDMTTTPIPVAPTAHYSCGGIVTCANGLSDVQGLYAAGEVAYTGLHGANRLASNSLLECIVVGRNIAAHLPQYLANSAWVIPTLVDTQIVAVANAQYLNYDDTSNSYAFDFDRSSIDYNDKTDSNIDSIATLDEIALKLKQLMSSNMGIIRHADQLQQALAQLKQWQSLMTPSMTIPSTALRRFQLSRQLQLATLIVRSALARKESRGGHYRSDFPVLSDRPLISIIEPEPVDKTIRVNAQLSPGFLSYDNASSNVSEETELVSIFASV